MSKPTSFGFVEAKVEPFSKWLQIQKYHEPKTQNDRTKTKIPVFTRLTINFVCHLLLNIGVMYTSLGFWLNVRLVLEFWSIPDYKQLVLTFCSIQKDLFVHQYTDWNKLNFQHSRIASYTAVTLCIRNVINEVVGGEIKAFNIILQYG